MVTHRIASKSNQNGYTLPQIVALRRGTAGCDATKLMTTQGAVRFKLFGSPHVRSNWSDVVREKTTCCRDCRGSFCAVPLNASAATDDEDEKSLRCAGARLHPESAEVAQILHPALCTPLSRTVHVPHGSQVGTSF
jgi:hypothetical protein